MKTWRELGRLPAWLGADHGGDRYGYEDDERFGPMSASRRPERWVRTTCGYCSVGCGMLVGVRDGRAVAVQGDPDHPVNRGRLCPKGLTEHHTIGADGRCTASINRKRRRTKFLVTTKPPTSAVAAKASPSVNMLSPVSTASTQLA